MSEFYHEELLHLYRHPLNKHPLNAPTHSHRETNPNCGDTLELQLVVEDRRIMEIGFQGQGCAISEVAASLLTETIKGKDLASIGELTTEHMIEMLGIPHLNPTRLRCATLALEGLKKMLPPFPHTQSRQPSQRIVE